MNPHISPGFETGLTQEIRSTRLDISEIEFPELNSQF